MKKEKRVLYDYVKEKQENKNKEKELKLKKEKFKKPKLDYDYIKNIIDNQIMPNNKDIFYTLDKSNSTDSYYIMFFYGDTYVTARISDHESKIGALGIVINENTTKKDIVEALEKRIIALKAKYKGKCFKEFQKEINKNVKKI